MASRNIYFEFFKISAFYSHARATGYTSGQGVVKHGRWNALIFAWSMCDARETGASARIAR
jgi:hypothetical protein